MCQGCSSVSRRDFLTLVSAGAAGLGAAPLLGNVQGAEPAPLERPPATKVRVGKVYLGHARPGWPKAEVDLAAEVKRFEAELVKLAPALSDVEFVGGDLVTNVKELAAAQQKLEGVSGILAIHLTLGTGDLIRRLLEPRVPVVLYSSPYAGHEWHTIASMQRQGLPIECLATGSYADLATAVRPFRAIHRLREAKVLCVLQRGANPDYVKAVKQKFGTEIQSLSAEDLAQAYQRVPEAEAAANADRWIRGAEKIVEPSKEDIVRAARMDLALHALVREHQAAAITINCLGMGLVERGMGYPCLGFCRLNDSGLGGICEADLKSTMTHLIFLNLAGKPGFVSDPVIDLSNNTIIHAHCVSATRMDGPDGPSAPYVIRSHLEDDKSCVLQVKMRVGQKTSMARLIGDDIMLFSTGEIVDIPDVDRGCRTKITTKVGDAQKFLDNWSCGLHRVVFYGDHTQDIRRYCRLMKIRLLHEGIDDLREVPGLEWEPRVHA